jgi:DNA-binding LacI/PurR family transcriptional regulator
LNDRLGEVRMPISMKDIARAAGVTESTVSRALADSPRVNLGTRKRIQRLARDMGFVPSAIARGLAIKRTSTLGVVIMDIGDPFVAKMVLSIDRQAQPRGYSVILSTAGTDPEREVSAMRLLLQQRVDAIIVPDPLISDSSLSQLQQIGVPVVLINGKRYPYSVGTDSVAAGRMAVNHLLELGHERIAYIAGNRSLDESLERQAGYEQALAGRGIPIDPALIVQGDGWVESGERAMMALLDLAYPPTAVFCFNDLTAAGALLCAYRAGFHVPRDLSVVGFDDSTASYLVPPLTTVSQDSEKLAESALQMALGLLAGRELPFLTTLPAELILRESTAPPRAGC